MLNRALALALLTLVLGSCSSEDKQDQEATKPPAGSTTAQIDYGEGFFAPERGQDGSIWRWMGPEGVVRLRNAHRDMLLTIKGHGPAEVPLTVMINVRFNGEPIDQISATREEMLKQYTIPAAKQGSGEWSELRLTTSQSYVPHDADAKSPDTRRLAFSLSDLTWTPK